MKVKAELVVSRIIEGYGFEGYETRKTRDGEEYKAYVTVWTKDSVTLGDSVEVTGDLTAKLDEYTTKEGKSASKVSLDVNNPTIKKNDLPF